MFSDNYIRLCNEYGKAVTSVAVELGYSKASGAKWANGSKPHKTTLAKIAKYFGVTVDELTADNKKTAAPEGDGQLERNALLIELFESLPLDRQLAVIRQLQEIARLQKAQDALLGL